MGLLPGVPNRQGQVLLPAAPPAAPVAYVTGTVTTPKGRHCRVPLASIAQERGALPVHSSGFLPKWARSNPSMDMASIQSSVFSVQNSSAFPGNVQADSKASFRWAPERASVQSWHQKLSETYNGYNMVNMIGEGRHGAVFIVQHRVSEKYYACKLLYKRDHKPDELQSEIDMLRRLDHPNIVRLTETNEDADAVFLLMELCHGGDLFGRISDEGHLPEGVARTFARQMFKALAYCHAKGIAHHDIKPENFLLETEDPDCLMLKLADFGIATSIRPSKLASTTASESEVKGSIPYMAPERFLRRWDSLVVASHAEGQSLAAGDAWSSGIVLYVMLSGDLPYGESVNAICSGQPPDFSAEVWKTVSEEAVDLIKRLLCPDVEKRWTAQQALAHPWFGDGTDSTLPVGHTERHQLARAVVQSLRRWRQFPKLKRIAMAAIAKRLEAEHPALRLAQAAYDVFSTSLDKLRCEEFIHALNGDLCEAMAAPGDSAASFGEAPQPFQPLGSAAPTPEAPQTRTGLHVRRAVKGMMGRLRKLAEDTPLGSSPSESPGMAMPGDDLVSLTELRCLVESLDGVKNGTVDFTLLVAAMLQPEALADETLVAEAFGMFDFRKRGGISADDLLTYMRTAMSSKDANAKRFSEMIAEFDLNDDGVLDLAEWRAMLQGRGVRDGTPVTSPGPLT